MSAVSTVKLQVGLQIIDEDTGNVMQFEVVSHESDFALNKIPTASCTVAVGREVTTLRAALIHSEFPKIKKMFRAKVFLRPFGQWARSRGLSGDFAAGTGEGLWDTAGQQVIFDGYVTGIGYRKQRGSLRIVINMIHWLSDLAFSSVFSNQSHPSNPSDLTFNAVHLPGGGNNTGPNAFTVRGHFANALNLTNLQQDLWSNAIAEIFCLASQRDLIQLGPPTLCGGTMAQNDAALRALKRIEGTHSCGPGQDPADSPHHVPLRLTGIGSQAMPTARAIANYIGAANLNTWWATTIWDTLVHDLAPSFAFSIVPLVETAIIVPFVPGLRDVYSSKIEVQDISTLHTKSLIRRPLRGVGVYGGLSFNTSNNGSDGSQNSINRRAGIGGCFMPDPDEKGIIIIQPAPPWMKDIPNRGRRPSQTTSGTSSATTPGAPGAADPNLPDKKATIAVQTSGLYGDMAQHVYMMEILRGRSGLVAGKFRMDIAPGTNVLVRDIGGQHIGAADLASPDVYASVMRVSLGIDAEAGKAATVFALSHVRTSTENGDDKTSIESHPLYPGQKFLGAPLVDEYLFDP